MLKPILLALLTACGGHSTAPSEPGEEQPVEPPDIDDAQEDQHFCCKSVDLEKWTGEDCVAISKEHINSCNEVLYCPGLWGKSNGVVKCRD
jgi:hypothetical protein